MKRLLLFLLTVFLWTSFALAANTQSDYKARSGVRSVMVLDTTNADGDNCLLVEGYTYKSIIVVETSGTAVWDISFSNNFKVSYDDLWTGEAASESYEFMTAATHVCINLTTCTTCQLDVTILAQDQRKESER